MGLIDKDALLAFERFDAQIEEHTADDILMITGETHRGKPRICEVLGVEVGEQFGISTMPGVVFWICEDGTFDTCPGGAPKSVYHFLRAVEHPDRILRKPRFSEEEVAIMRVLHKVGVSAIELPFGSAGDIWTYGGYEGAIHRTRYVFPAGCFPSLLPGQSVALGEATGHDQSQAL